MGRERGYLALPGGAKLDEIVGGATMLRQSASVTLSLSEPRTVAIAPPEIQDWGPYQFCGLSRMPDSRILLTYHLEADSSHAYGMPPGCAISSDDGKTWTTEPNNALVALLTASCGTLPLRLPNGDWFLAKQLRSLPASELALPKTPFGATRNYRRKLPAYWIEDLAKGYQAGWSYYRLPAGETHWIEEQAAVHMPGEVRLVAEGMLVFPWFGEVFVAPDGALWAVQYNNRITAGVLQEQYVMAVLRSTDNGRNFALWSEIDYQPDRAADPHADLRDGFSEPTVCFMPDGSAFCLLRTTDGEGVGPLYWARSTDNGKTWSQPRVFDDRGVWPQMLTLKSGVTLAVYGRPGLFVRASADPAGAVWDARIAVIEAADTQPETCAYAALLALDDDTALLAYADFNVRDGSDRRCKGIRVREIRAVTRR